MHCKCSPDAAERWLEKLSFPLLEFWGAKKWLWHKERQRQNQSVQRRRPIRQMVSCVNLLVSTEHSRNGQV